MPSSCIHYFIESKGKGHPTTGHEVQEVEQRCSSTLSFTSALDGSVWSMPRPGGFTSRERGKIPIVLEAGWAPVTVWTGAGKLTPHRDLIPGSSST
jgi:hypothetical protein